MKTGTSLTDAEIIKALKCCSRNKCTTDGCPLAGNSICMTNLTTYALDLINRLKAENERLKSKVNRLKRYDEERDIRLHARLIATAKSEAYKKFAERLLRKATIMRDEPQTNGVVRVGHIYETLEEMGCGE